MSTSNPDRECRPEQGPAGHHDGPRWLFPLELGYVFRWSQHFCSRFEMPGERSSTY